MSINGEFDNISRGDLLEFANRNNIKDAGEIIDGVMDAASRWPLIVKECGVPAPMIKAILPEMRQV